MFDDKDKDLDGRLSFEEFMGEQSRAERLFKLMDKDGDGFVTKNVSYTKIVRIAHYFQAYLYPCGTGVVSTVNNRMLFDFQEFKEVCKNLNREQV